MLKKLSLYTLLLSLVPIFVWLTGYHWAGNSQLASWDYPLYLLTETGSTPYALITCVVFALLFRVLFKSNRQWFWGVVIMALSVVGSQALKSGLKTLLAEPRPFVTYMAEQTHTSTDDFYALDRDARPQLVNQYFTQQSDTPAWLEQHYEHETGYSFPSGHTIFAATWLMLAVGFAQLLNKRSLGTKLLIGGIFIWAVLMLISRVRLGMHYPQDLLAGIIAAWLVNAVIFGFLRKKGLPQEKLSSSL